MSDIAFDNTIATTSFDEVYVIPSYIDNVNRLNRKAWTNFIRENNPDFAGDWVAPFLLEHLAKAYALKNEKVEMRKDMKKIRDRADKHVDD